MYRLEKSDTKPNYVEFNLFSDTDYSLQTTMLVCKGTYNLQDKIFNKDCYFENLENDADLLDTFTEYGVVHICVDEYSCVTMSCADIEVFMNIADGNEHIIRKVFSSLCMAATHIMRR